MWFGPLMMKHSGVFDVETFRCVDAEPMQHASAEINEYINYENNLAI